MTDPKVLADIYWGVATLVAVLVPFYCTDWFKQEEDNFNQ